MDTPQFDRIGRLPEALSLTGLRRSAFYTRIADKLMTPPVPLGGRAVGWPIREIGAINAARIAGQSNDQIRELVATLIADRAKAVQR